ncbi:hypothetical protein TNCV_322801 [Trichonephila clavipes]|nr:hypothetical protein TNCV_322801 [Trichonephila clavipes]
MTQRNETGPINHCTYRISSPWQYHLPSSSLQHSHTSALIAVIAGNSSGTRFLKGPTGDSPLLSEHLQLSTLILNRGQEDEQTKDQFKVLLYAWKDTRKTYAILVHVYEDQALSMKYMYESKSRESASGNPVAED